MLGCLQLRQQKSRLWRGFCCFAGGWISPNLVDCPAFPSGFCMAFSSKSIRLPGNNTTSNQFDLVEVDVALSKEVFDSDRAPVVIDDGIITLLQ
jgi:hypothetical protein